MGLTNYDVLFKRYKKIIKIFVKSTCRGRFRKGIYFSVVSFESLLLSLTLYLLCVDPPVNVALAVQYAQLSHSFSFSLPSLPSLAFGRRICLQPAGRLVQPMHRWRFWPLLQRSCSYSRPRRKCAPATEQDAEQDVDVEWLTATVEKIWRRLNKVENKVSAYALMELRPTRRGKGFLKPCPFSLIICLEHAELFLLRENRTCRGRRHRGVWKRSKGKGWG